MLDFERQVVLFGNKGDTQWLMVAKRGSEMHVSVMEGCTCSVLPTVLQLTICTHFTLCIF